MKAYLTLQAQDPIIARDGRPFGIGQGRTMRGLLWPLPSMVAGSFRTALIKSTPDLNFSEEILDQLVQIDVAGLLPQVEEKLYLPAPMDCVWDGKNNKIFRTQPEGFKEGEGMDLPVSGLLPVQLTQDQAREDFKAKSVPAWWPMDKYEDWLKDPNCLEKSEDWFDSSFLGNAIQQMRDHVQLDNDRGASEEGKIFASSNLTLTHLPKFGVAATKPFHERYAEIQLAARVKFPEDNDLKLKTDWQTWHPLGGERRLVHWHRQDSNAIWQCPTSVRDALSQTKYVRMVLVTPAIFSQGWQPDFIHSQLEGSFLETGLRLKLVGASIGRWKAVSGWSMAEPRGPKAIRRMVPAGSVYFFEVLEGDITKLADHWLESVCMDERAKNDGFGLAIWGTWNLNEGKK